MFEHDHAAYDGAGVEIEGFSDRLIHDPTMKKLRVPVTGGCFPVIFALLIFSVIGVLGIWIGSLFI